MANWDDEGFTAIVRTGKGGLLSREMPWQAHKTMRDEDFTAILAYLKSMPAVKHLVVNQAPPPGVKFANKAMEAEQPTRSPHPIPSIPIIHRLGT